MALSRNRLYLFLGLSCLAGYTWIIISNTSDNIAGNNYNVCIIKHITGIPCPSCGSTRSIVSLLHGNLAESFYWNPIGIFLAMVLIIAPVWIVYDFSAGRDTLLRHYKKAEAFLEKREIALIAIILIVANWIWNIYKGL